MLEGEVAPSHSYRPSEFVALRFIINLKVFLQKHVFVYFDLF